ncbi:hypothetical protein NTE_03171 [Candidatus Nitrososphaera evergladensis SR1]|jgi:uncharacterized protein (DUF1697 family)|uniref:DUF1697 domain-containing protein n=1 Tax=Candidatus Nitrososphaera evergladensis SR1 TaxID=1459636 RepID=A0A075MVL3_9ARCH|nr:DUF1697 domain-containing protein [Candidatus Nitrososphaera evergladensis]AIF85203.1 hypothetical protein NTE_03171 [Candidatus Nitrososphaera evergladensis SR1]
MDILTDIGVVSDKVGAYQYLALLRGINVGGNNVIRMNDLTACFEEMGFADVATYIQSGNILFRTDEQDRARLTDKIERVLSDTFHYNSRVVVITHKQLKSVVEGAPRQFGKDATRYRYDVIFLKEPLTAKTAMKSVSVRDGVDSAYEGKSVLYFSRLIAKAAQSRLPKIITLPVYQNMTIRNWNTTTTLLALMDKKVAVK